MMIKRILLGVFLISVSTFSIAGVDITGKIVKVWLKDDDKLWFKLDTSQVDTYCKPVWFGFNLYVPKSDKDFPYYYGLITSANANGQSVRISNINVFNGSTACNIIETDYGIVVHPKPAT